MDTDLDNKHSVAHLPTASQSHLSSEPVFPTAYPICELLICVGEGCCPHFADIEGGIHRRVVVQGVHGPAGTVPVSCASPSTHPCWPPSKPGCVLSSHEGRNRMGPSVTVGPSRNWQGSDSSGYPGAPGLGWGGTRGPRAHGPSNYLFLSLAVILLEQ